MAGEKAGFEGDWGRRRREIEMTGSVIVTCGIFPNSAKHINDSYIYVYECFSYQTHRSTVQFV